MNERAIPRWSGARRFVAGTAAALTSLVWAHGMAGVLRHLGSPDAPLAAAGLSLAAVAVAVTGAVALPRRSGPLVAAAAGLAALGALQIAAPGSWAGALALPLVGVGVTVGAGWLGGRLPDWVDGFWSRRRTVALVWAALSIASIVQMGRLSTRMTDWSTDFVLTTRNPFWHTHQCLSAYLYGAELAVAGDENLYDPGHYPALDPQASPQSHLEGMTVEDPYQYPPQFLLLPRLALALSDDFRTIRVVWYALQVSLFVGIFVALALWMGHRTGRLALWLLPGALIAFPMLHTFQFGQFHLTAVALAVGAMLAFDAGRRAGGGFLLASAILAKVFPAVLLLPLLATRRFRELAWTAGWGLALTVLALAVLGPAPFEAFFEDHVPRLVSGAAFAFDEAWPELTDLVVADNQGVFGLARKLGLEKTSSAAVARGYGIALVALATWVGFRLRGASRTDRGILWVALLGLASLASPGAWGDYVPSTAIWLLAVLAWKAAEERAWAWPLGTIAAFQFFLVGTMPVGDWAPPTIMIPLSAVGVVGMLALFGTVAVSGRPVAKVTAVARGHDRLKEAVSQNAA